MADGCREKGNAQKNQNWTKCLVEIWADEEIQRQLLAMGREHNIWENMATKLNDKCEYHETAQIIQPCMKHV